MLARSYHSKAAAGGGTVQSIQCRQHRARCKQAPFLQASKQKHGRCKPDQQSRKTSISKNETGWDFFHQSPLWSCKPLSEHLLCLMRSRKPRSQPAADAHFRLPVPHPKTDVLQNGNSQSKQRLPKRRISLPLLLVKIHRPCKGPQGPKKLPKKHANINSDMRSAKLSKGNTLRPCRLERVPLAPPTTKIWVAVK